MQSFCMLLSFFRLSLGGLHRENKKKRFYAGRNAGCIGADFHPGRYIIGIYQLSGIPIQNHIGTK